ncbi:WD40 repeat-like protein [Tilletiaria anomala UBC 951]|uniref:WD40 repeat-like protein n=1 Tax=Tilletiaria anomala (strain ATCC 24038 / CBS 436.72 / UBC 951) TaxID=1037660 RepID=A0A066VM09_TILAU|nr:WD40 repeat-like protein [Tilletiaria anomala UBC 951]KDN42521.1 WD40 repeat-like protein [Tilletiaria anomala UBC 951]
MGSTTSYDSSMGGSRPTTPRKGRTYIDRFIPTRNGDDLHDAYQMLDDEPITPKRQKRKIPADMDTQKAEANQAFSSVLGTELFGDLASGAAARAYALNGGVTGVPAASPGSGPNQSPRTPSRRNLFSYQSPTSASSRDRRRAEGSVSRVYAGSSDSPAGLPILFSGSSTAGDIESLDSPLHKAYSTSPVKAESQKLLQSPKRTPRTLSKVPFKVLDAPELADDFYLNLVDWSVGNVLGVGLGACVYLWSAKDSAVTKLCDLKGKSDKVTSLNWTGRGTHVAVGTNSGNVQIWDAETCKLIRTMGGHSARVGSLAWNEHILTSGSRDRIIYHRDVRVPEHTIRELRGHRQEVCGLKWNSDSNQLASGGNDNRLYVWEGLMESPLYRFTNHKAAVKAIAWSPHQQGLLASGGGTADMTIRFWNTLNGTMTSEIDTGSQICNLMWSKTSNELVSTHGYSAGKVQNQIQVWRYPNMQQVATLTGHTMRVLYLAMSPDGETIVTGAGDETLRFWGLNTPRKSMIEKRNQSTALNPFAKLR